MFDPAVLFAVFLFIGCALVAVGSGLVFVPAGLMSGGVLLSAWSWLVFTDDAEVAQ